MFKVKFVPCPSTGNGAGYIDGYHTARRAKQVVQMVNDANTGVHAEYLGRAR